VNRSRATGIAFRTNLGDRRGVARALIFDLDGTLVDSLEDLAAALDAALVDHGLPTPTRAQVRTWVGGGARALVAHAVTAAQVDPVLARFAVHYAAAPVVRTVLYPGLAPVLDELAAGHRLAVLTNKPEPLAVAICGRLLARWPFAIIHGQRPGVPLKPDPTSALAIAHALAVEPAACAVIGDAPTDVATAHAGGMRAVGVTWGYRSRAELTAARPTLLVDRPEELRALVAG
jgi:phosphoglycolate phosphatase